MNIALLWDASGMWGLLAARALRALGLPFRLVKAASIGHCLATDKPFLVLVPGGTASLKYTALGPDGRQALRDWVQQGGHYLGFCGGAGLALSDSDAGLGLCPWRRAGFSDRLQHFLSGHVRLERCAPGPGETSACGSLLAPVWWPARFAEPAGDSAGVRVLARYTGPGPDLHVADFALAQLPEAVRQEWAAAYNIHLTPEAFGGAPCVVHGAAGRGSYTLSYSHLESPASPQANAWLAELLAALGKVTPTGCLVPEWEPHPAERMRGQGENREDGGSSGSRENGVRDGSGAECGNGARGAMYGSGESGKTGNQAVHATLWPADQHHQTADLSACLGAVHDLFTLGRAHGLFFDRSPWLTGWRLGVPGASLNNLALMLRGLAEMDVRTPLSPAFQQRFALFCARTRSLLLAQRLAVTMPDAVPREPLAARRAELFGAAMRAGGLYQELICELDDVLFEALQGASQDI